MKTNDTSLRHEMISYIVNNYTIQSFITKTNICPLLNTTQYPFPYIEIPMIPLRWNTYK